MGPMRSKVKGQADTIRRKGEDRILLVKYATVLLLLAWVCTSMGLHTFLADACVEGRPRRGVVDNQLPARTGDRLHQAVHEPRHQHPLQASCLCTRPRGWLDIERLRNGPTLCRDGWDALTQSIGTHRPVAWYNKAVEDIRLRC